MAEEASRSTNSASTIKSRSLTRRNSLPLFRSDLGKDVPGYLRTSTCSCHDHCTYWRREMAQVEPYQPANKRHVAHVGLKASDKPQLGKNDPSKPQCSPIKKTSEPSSKQSKPRDKDIITKSSVKPKLLKEKSMTRKSAATSGDEKLKRQKEIAPGSVSLRDARTNNRSNERRSLTKSAKGPSTNAVVKLYAKTRPKMVERVKIISSSSPQLVIKARAQSPPTKLKPVGLRVKSSSSPPKSRLVRLRVNAASSPTTVRPVSLMVNSTASPVKLKPASLKVNSSSSSGSVKPKHATTKTSPRSISPRSVPSKKSIIIRSQTVKTRKSSKVPASETVATRRGSVFPDFEDAENSEKKELQQENLVEAQTGENEELLMRSLVDDQIDEKKQVFENNKEDLSHEIEIQNPEGISESKYDEASEKTLYVIETYAEDEIPDMQPLASVSPPLSPTSPITISESNITTEPEASLKDVTNSYTDVPCADQETPDVEPLPSLSPEIPPESQFSIVVSNEASLYEVSLDGSVYTDSEEGYSSSEDEHLVEGENLKGKKKSATQENAKDPVKLRFRRGRVIDVTDENHCPRRLKFRRARILDEKAVNDLIRKRSFMLTDATQVDITTENNSSSVVLRHQDMQDKKDAQVLFNNVIEKTASKLVEKRKSMVKALVGAFETVISLQDGKPATTQEDQ